MVMRDNDDYVVELVQVHTMVWGAEALRDEDIFTTPNRGICVEQ